MAQPTPVAEEALTSMLLPIWQLVIGACVLLVVIVSAYRLARRGRSRMTTALVVVGAALLGIAAIGMLLQAGGQ